MHCVHHQWDYIRYYTFNLCIVYTYMFMNTRAYAIMSRQAWDSWTDASRLVYASAFASNEVNVNEAQTSPDTVVRPSLLFTLSRALAAILCVHTIERWFFSNRPFVRSTRSTNYNYVVNARGFARKQPVLLTHKEFRKILEIRFTISRVTKILIRIVKNIGIAHDKNNITSKYK